jgi:DNA-binding transcriptional ArsR family regulator
MFASVVDVEGKLAKCVQNYADDRCSLLELLRFLGKHPYTRFSRAAIVLALRNQGVFVERGLKYLVDNGIVTFEEEKKIQLYSLTGSEPMRNWALELVRLDWCQWQSVLRQIA